MGTRSKQDILGFIKKIPLIVILLFFFAQCGVLIGFIIPTIISFGQVVALFLFWLFIWFSILLVFFRKKNFFSVLGVNEFILFLIVPFFMTITLVVNYYVSEPIYETSFFVDDYNIIYDNERDLYWIGNYEVPNEYQKFLYFVRSDYNYSYPIFELKIRQGALGYKIIESKKITTP